MMLIYSGGAGRDLLLHAKELIAAARRLPLSTFPIEPEERENRSENVTPESERGNSGRCTLKQLNRERPDRMQ
jgi:hypothetical protein